MGLAVFVLSVTKIPDRNNVKAETESASWFQRAKFMVTWLQGSEPIVRQSILVVVGCWWCGVSDRVVVWWWWWCGVGDGWW